MDLALLQRLLGSWYAEHNIDFELPDSMEQSLDLIMEYCDPRFKRLHTFDKIDGNHMAYAHPMDCYGLCK